MTQTCYILSTGSYSDYTVWAAYSTKELAEEALLYYDGCDDPRIEEIQLDPPMISAALPPAGYAYFGVSSNTYLGKSSIHCFKTAPIDLRPDSRLGVVSESKYMHNRHSKTVIVLARDEDHAIKIAAEKFAEYEARQAGIA